MYPYLLYITWYCKTVGFPQPVTCFSYPSVCRTGVVTRSEQEARAPTPTVLFPGTGPSHGDPLLWRHGQVTAPTAVCWQNCEQETTGYTDESDMYLSSFESSTCKTKQQHVSTAKSLLECTNNATQLKLLNHFTNPSLPSSFQYGF